MFGHFGEFVKRRNSFPRRERGSLLLEGSRCVAASSCAPVPDNSGLSHEGRGAWRYESETNRSIAPNTRK